MTKVSLIILDGWGLAPSGPHNAISMANTPCWNKLIQQYPMTELTAHGENVGLAPDTMGNSEVGHLNIGAGRIVYQDSLKVTNAIENQSFFHNPVLLDTLKKAENKTLHIMGLLSPGYIHSHEQHIFAVLKAAKAHGLTNVVLHAFLDGRDTAPKSAKASLEKTQELMSNYGMKGIATIAGRFFAMDRDKRFERTQAAYQALLGQAEYSAKSATEALDAAYARGETDEFVTPTTILNTPISSDDVVLFMNFRADRARQLTRALSSAEFNDFTRTVRVKDMATLTPYASDIKLPAMFTPEPLQDVFGEVISKANLKQLRLAETEKYAHVTYFFNGGQETPFANETRILCPSPKVKTYDEAPAMSIEAVKENYLKEVGNYDVCVVNIANADMVGHTGNFDATVKAIEAVDAALKEMLDAANAAGHIVAITADHGNADQMQNEQTGQPHTAHSLNPVPFIITRDIGLKSGNLGDIAPTLLALLGLEQPDHMTGHSLIKT